MNLLALILIMILLFLVYVKVNFKNFSSQNKVIKIICKTPISKDSYILIVKIMTKYYLCSSTQSEFRVIENVDETELNNYLNLKKEVLSKEE